MINIQGNKRKIYIPSSWDDLTIRQLRYTAYQLFRLTSKEITLTEFQINVMLFCTGYRPTVKSIPIIFYFKLVFQCIKSVRYGRKACDVIRSWITCYRPDILDRDQINDNLLYLSSLITFPIKDENAVTLFYKNPLPYIYIRGRKFKGKKFDIGYINKTDITAREFCDALDLIKTFAESKEESCLNSLCAILYPLYSSHAENMLSNHEHTIAKADFITRYIIMLWFVGIVTYITEHPIYSILFSCSHKNGPDTISIGAYEGIMHLTLNGFGSKEELERVNLIDYFDMQVKVMKKIVAEMKGAGMKDVDIAKATGLTFTNLYKLI